MNEQQIAARLQATVPVTEHTPADPVVSDPTLVPVDIKLDELAHYKLAPHFNDTYDPSDHAAISQTEFIYRAASEAIGTSDYLEVVTHIRNLQRMLGIAHDDNSRSRLYQWLKLDQQRTKIEREMGNV